MGLWDKIAAVVFDFDGTLVHQTIDFNRMRTDVTAVLRQYGVDDPVMLQLHILEMVGEAVAQLKARGHDPAPLLAAAYAAIELIECEAAQEAYPIPGVRALLSRLQASGMAMGVVTRNSLRSVLTAFADIETLCDVVLPRESVCNVKPHPEHLAACLARLHVSSEQAVMVGDHPLDIEAGCRQGLRTVGVLTGSGTAAALRQAGADVILNNATELWALLAL